MIVSSITSPGVGLNRQKLKTWAEARTAHVIAHEQSHLAGLGPVGGTMHLDFAEVDGVRFAAGGSVKFAMPHVDTSSQEAVQRSKVLFGHVLTGATAVGDMSSADAGIAASATHALAQVNRAEHAWDRIGQQAQLAGMDIPKLKPGFQLDISA